MLRPRPSYLISSLCRSRSSSSVGSSRASPILIVLPDAVRRTAAREAFGAALAWAAGAGAGFDDGQNVHSNSTSAIVPSSARAITSFRFSVPSFTSGALQVTVQRHFQLDRPGSLAPQVDAVHIEKQFRALQRVDKAHQLPVVAGERALDRQRRHPVVLLFQLLVFRPYDAHSVFRGELAQRSGNIGIARRKAIAIERVDLALGQFNLLV